MWLSAAPAFAHTSFEASNPADGSTVDTPIDRIELIFSGEAEPAGDGFVVFDPSGTIVVPDRINSKDNLTWVLEFDESLAGGAVGVRWSVAAADAHPIEGSFTFTTPGIPKAPSESATGSAEANPQVASANLSEFLDAEAGKAPLLVVFGVIARSLALLGAMVAIGGVVFAAVVMRGSERDIRGVLFWVRRAAVILGFGATLELIHQLAVVNGNWLTIWPLATIGQTLWSPLGLAIALRFAGAGLILRAHLNVVRATVAADPVIAMHAAVPIGAGQRMDSRGPGDAQPYLRPDDKAWRVDGELVVVLVGIIAALMSFTFDGHTVTEGVRSLTALVAMVHVATGAVWAGGLAMLIYVVWIRHRRGEDSQALQLAVRFSVVAAAALVLAGLAGGILSFIILDRASELWSTPWGRVLLAKVATVGVAGAAGGYNHKVLIPHMMRRAPNDPRADSEFRRTVTVEGAAVVVVVALTALLVGAAS
jgi:copper transport protein